MQQPVLKYIIDVERDTVYGSLEICVLYKLLIGTLYRIVHFILSSEN